MMDWIQECSRQKGLCEEARRTWLLRRTIDKYQEKGCRVQLEIVTESLSGMQRFPAFTSQAKVI